MSRKLLLLTLLALAGCQTVPEAPTTLLSPVQDGRGRIVVRPFYVPLGMNLVAALMGGGAGGFRTHVYDVTCQQGPLATSGFPAL